MVCCKLITCDGNDAQQRFLLCITACTELCHNHTNIIIFTIRKQLLSYVELYQNFLAFKYFTHKSEDCLNMIEVFSPRK